MIALLGSACHFLLVSSRITAVEKKKNAKTVHLKAQNMLMIH